MYNLINTINVPIQVKSGKPATPVAGYVLENTEDKSIKAYSKKEGYDLVQLAGSDNMEAKTRIGDNNEELFYLRPKDRFVKINAFIKLVQDLDASIPCTEKFLENLEKVRSQF